MGEFNCTYFFSILNTFRLGVSNKSSSNTSMAPNAWKIIARVVSYIQTMVNDKFQFVVGTKEYFCIYV